VLNYLSTGTTFGFEGTLLGKVNPDIADEIDNHIYHNIYSF
jgi:hypothetical protein